MKKIGLTAAAIVIALLMTLVLIVTMISGQVVNDRAEDCVTNPSVPAEQVGNGKWREPIQQNYKVTSRPGDRDSIRNGRPHSGIDLVTLPNPGPLVAASAGTVHHAGDGYGTYGISVVLNHGGGIWSVYGHMSKLASGIREGAKVSIGQELGTEGSTGNSSGSHVHFEIDKGSSPGTFIDPVKFMRSKGVEFDGKASPQGDASPEPKIANAKSSKTAPTAPKTAGAQPVAAAPAAAEQSAKLPSPKGFPRKNSKDTKAIPIPKAMKKYYVGAGKKYGLPWTLLAGVGMEETLHGTYAQKTSSAGAGGAMQFIASTWASMGVDGDGDGKTDRYNDADSVYSAANYLVTMGARKGPEAVMKAINGYNPGAAEEEGNPRTSWYVGDVLYYAAAYGGGTIPVSGEAGSECVDPVPVSDTDTKKGDGLASKDAKTVVKTAQAESGDAYRLGANGPNVWDCSSLTLHAYKKIGITLPRNSQAQRDWLADGNGIQIKPGQEQPGDLVFWNSYNGPPVIGHVAIVADPKKKSTIEARDPKHGVGSWDYTRAKGHEIYEIWRPKAKSNT